MIRSTVLLLMMVLLGSCKDNKNAERVENNEPKKEDLEFVALFNAGMEEGVNCYRIPAIVTAPNGDLIAAIDQRVPDCGDLKWSRDINIIVRRSSDNGKTWTPIEMVIDFPEGKSASDPSMIVDEVTGDIFMFYNYMNLDTEKDIYYLHVMKSSGIQW